MTHAHSAVGAHARITTIAEDLLWLLLDDFAGNTTVDSITLHRVLAGAVLAELRSHDGAVPPRDPLLATVVAGHRRIVLDRAVDDLATGVRGPLLDRLCADHRVDRRTRRSFRFIPRTTWPTSDPAGKAELRHSLHSAVLDAHTPDTRTLALIGLLHTAGALPYQFPRWSRNTIDRRGRQICLDHPDFADIIAAVRHAVCRARADDYTVRYGF
ncbi:GOLPH3/VPS74 family protein [Nocardia bovistercoris]|uniref:GPP34 family phosphoprotein n=1 Tax=Nocardia bovistercoris TaxID=2785916 RepID=A0A931N329_9NOCA|nr:GPP34 family phosphoprotein [Nocardia bovistercoris]MBH0776691.1 GPP34 family phosphoprotein [Nocardia bovistercoris]